MTVLGRARRVAGRVRRSPVARRVLGVGVRHAAPGAAAASLLAARRGHQCVAHRLRLGAGVLWWATWLRERRRGRRDTAEHVARMRRLRPDVLKDFYITCIASMEKELEEFPEYDRHKHNQRYRLLGDLACRHAPRGGLVVDVGCATAIALDEVHRRRGTVGVGFDLSPNGVRDRAARPDAPVLAQAVVEDIPLRDGVADVVIFSEVIEHLIDAYAGLREVNRVTRPGGILILTTNNNSEMPLMAPLRDPLSWAERLAGRWWSGALAFRNLTWHLPVNLDTDPLPRDAPTYAPHFWFTFAELRDLGADAGFELLSSSSFEFPPPQTRVAMRLRAVSRRRPRIGGALSDTVEAVVARVPGLNLMGTHHCLVLRKCGPALQRPRVPWWPAMLVEDQASPEPAPPR